VKKVKTIIGGICLPLYLVWVYFNSIEGASTKYYWFDYFTVILFMLMSIYFWLDKEVISFLSNLVYGWFYTIIFTKNKRNLDNKNLEEAFSKIDVSPTVNKVKILNPLP
jgi:hypothetical protein